MLRKDSGKFIREFNRIYGMHRFGEYIESISDIQYFNYLEDMDLDVGFDYFVISIAVENYVLDMEEEIDEDVKDLNYSVTSEYIRLDIMYFLEMAACIFFNERRKVDKDDIELSMNNPKITAALVVSTTISNFYRYLNSLLNSRVNYHLIIAGWPRRGSLHMLLTSE